MVQYRISLRFFNKIFNSFSKEVKEYKYNKLPYSKWCQIKHFINKNLFIPNNKTDILLITFFNLPENDNNIRMTMNTEQDSFVLRVDEYDDKEVLESVRGFIDYVYNQINKALEDKEWSLDPLLIKDVVLQNNNENEKENKTMIKGLNFDFGSCKDDNIKMSMFGIAIRNANGTFVSYDEKTKSIIDVDILNFDAGNFFFKMPVAISKIKTGMTIIHNRVPMFVEEVTETGVIAIDPRAGEKKNIIPTKNMFGFNFVTQIVSLFNITNANATEANPFGNMLPLLMMNENTDTNSLMLMAMCMNNMNTTNDNSFNPFMLMALADSNIANGDMSKLMLPMMFMNGNGFFPMQKD